MGLAILSENSIGLGIRNRGQNHRMIRVDVLNPALARNVHRDLLKSPRRLEAENLFLRHQRGIPK
jgi:hypothetical protein